MAPRPALPCALLLLALAACGGDPAAPAAPTGPNPCGACPTDHFCSNGRCVLDPGLAAGDEATCDAYGFTPTVEAAFARVAAGVTRVRFIASNVVVEPPFDKLTFELNHALAFPGGAPAPLTLSLADTGAPGGAVYLRGQTFCNDVDCASTYVATAGELVLDRPGAPGAPLGGTLRGLVLTQVRLDPSTGAIIPFSKAKVWCVGDYRFAVDVPALPVAEGQCVAAGTGREVGENIANFTLQNCYGEPVDLHARCGRAKAVWIVATAGWCGACDAFVPVAAERYTELADAGLDLMVVLGENGSAGPPSLAYCLDYAAAKGVDPAMVFVDHDGSAAWAATFGAIETYGDGSIGLPWNAVLDGRSMLYTWSSNAGSGDLYGAQDALLSAP